MAKTVLTCLVAAVMYPPGLLGPGALAAETVQPGFVLHDAGNANLSLSDVRSGDLCGDVGGQDSVCNTGTTLTVQGHDTYTGTDGKTYPCTRYGYRYDYAGATPDTEIECTATRRDRFNQHQKTCTVALDAESGSVYQPEWIPYGVIERRTMLTDLGKITFIFQLAEEDRLAITVLTGMQGPTDGAIGSLPSSRTGPDPRTAAGVPVGPRRKEPRTVARQHLGKRQYRGPAGSA